MKPSHESRSHQPTEPIQLGKPRNPETGPFILEDEDDELEPMGISKGHSASFTPPPILYQDPSRALREISPNTSQQRAGGATIDLGPEAGKPTMTHPGKEAEIPQHSPRCSPSKENDLPPPQPTHKLAEELNDILKRRTASSSSNPTAPPKRKSRPLGRNPSSISSRSGSVAAAPSIPADVFEENSAADGFDYSSTVPALPPSTQLGYDTPEAEAHREQMSKKMGSAIPRDEGVGKRVASVGTVKDSTARSAVGGRAKARSRTKTS